MGVWLPDLIRSLPLNLADSTRSVRIGIGIASKNACYTSNESKDLCLLPDHSKQVPDPGQDWVPERLSFLSRLGYNVTLMSRLRYGVSHFRNSKVFTQLI